MICIIPARGGSKRLPGKNIVDFYGVPIIYHAIQTARKSGLFDNIVVSTDSEEIYDIVDRFLCDVHFRPAHLCGDVSEADVLRDCAYAYEEETICRIYPFASLLTPLRLEVGYDLYNTGWFQTVMECQEYVHPPQRAFTRIGHEGRYLRGDNVAKRTQDLQPVYHDAGTFMFTNVAMLSLPLAEQKIGWIVVGEMEAQDIDTEEDLQMAKLKYIGGML